MMPHIFSQVMDDLLPLKPSSYVSLAIPVNPHNTICAYGLDKPVFKPYQSGDFIGSITQGGVLNCESVQFFPHASGTHTESLLHADIHGPTMDSIHIPPLMIAYVVSVYPRQMGNDQIIDSIPLPDDIPTPHAVIVRTLPNTSDKLQKDYTHSNPPYFSDKALIALSNKGVLHFLTDLPSVDKEVDGGALLAHKGFFAQRQNATITELIYVPDTISDGRYLLNLQYPSMHTDAVPSNPVLFIS
jgi:kynurenine formamidase